MAAKGDEGDIGVSATLTSAGTPAARASREQAALAEASGRYARGRELGRGGMGRVYEAIDRQFNRPVAIKEMHADDHGPARRRFDTEALVTGCINHPGVPAVHERGTDPHGVPFYVMRKVDGRTLSKLLAEATTPAERLALVPVVVKVAQTVAYAHEQGVIHRDVKPDNILVGKYGETTLVDWGIARVRGVPGEAAGDGAISGGSGTLHGSVVGTPAYMAPEQAEGDTARVDERSDVFAIGALLYHLLTGHAPYEGDVLATVLDAARKGRPRPVAEVARTAPPGLRAICEKAMARAPEQRYQSAKDLARALERFEAGALAARPRSSVTLTLNVLVAVATLLALGGSVIMARQLPSLHAQGMGVIPLVALALIGIALGVTEWVTVGRHGLSPIVLGLIAITLVTGASISLAGGGMVLANALRDEVFTQPDEFRLAIVSGAREALGAVSSATLLAVPQLVVWALARRRVALADRERAVIS